METGNPKIPFKHIISVIFNNWSGLKKLALEHGEHGMGDHDKEMKVSQLIDEIDQRLSAGNLQWEDVADLLTDFMHSDFSTCLEDDSCIEIGYQLYELYELYVLERMQEIKEILLRLPNKTPIKLNIPGQIHHQQPEFPVDSQEDSYNPEESDGWTGDGWVVFRRK